MYRKEQGSVEAVHRHGHVEDLECGLHVEARAREHAQEERGAHERGRPAPQTPSHREHHVGERENHGRELDRRGRRQFLSDALEHDADLFVR